MDELKFPAYLSGHMDTPLPSQRIVLSYQGATFQRCRVLLMVAGGIVLIMQLVRFPRQTPPPGTVAGPPIVDILLGVAVAFCLIYAVMDALFVAGVRSGAEKSCDKDNLYITRRGEETVIPLDTIMTIRLAAGGMGNGPRGMYRVYVIEYDHEGVTRTVEVYVYNRTQDSFNLFKTRVQQKNPSVRIKNWSTSLDGLISLFRRKGK